MARSPRTLRRRRCASETSRHLHQLRDAVLRVRVRREEVVGASSRKRVDNEEVRHRWIALGVYVHALACVSFNLLQRACERFRFAANLGANAVGFVFAGTG